MNTENMNESNIRYGMVGCGRIAHRHALEIRKKGTLVCVCDIDAPKAAAFAAQFGAKSYANYADMLAAEKELEVMIICTPNGLHARHSIDALQAGLHVLCEKPMALSSSDCSAMMETASKHGKHLVVVKQNRFNPAVAAVKKALDTGRLGRILSFQLSCFWNRGAPYYQHSWHGSLEMDGGTLYTQFSHFIDILQWFFGKPETTAGYFSNQLHAGQIEFEDTGAVILRFSGGIMGTLNYTVNSYQENMEGSLTLFGEKGTVKIGGQYLNTLSYQQLEGGPITYETRPALVNDYGFYQGSMSNHDRVYENLTDVIRNGAAMAASAWDGRQTVEMIEQIYRSRILQ